MKMIETLKEQMKNFLEEIEGKTTQKLDEINRYLKESLGKEITQVRETVQNLKIETEGVKQT